MRKLLARLLCASITAAPGLASATVLLIGGDHTISGQVNDSVVVDGFETRTTLNVTSGGVVTQGVTTQGRGQLNVTGNGRVNAASNGQAVWLGAVSHVRVSDNARITGDLNSDDTTPGHPDESQAYRSVILEDRAVLDGNFRASGNLRLQDQAVILGNVSSSQTIAFNMTGGTVSGTVGGSGNIDHYLNLSGGAVLGGITHGNSWTHLNMSGGYVGGRGIDTVGVLLADISGGQITGGLSHVNHYDYGYISITGGTIDADADDYLISIDSMALSTGRTRLDLWGGQLGYNEAGLGIWLDDALEFNIYGWDLSFSNGLLSGYLSDGNWFSSALTFGSNWNGQVQLHDVSVPEPGTNALLALGLAALAWQVRSSRRSKRTAI